MNRRLAVLAPVLAAAALAVPATAASRTVCLQIADATGDGMSLGAAPASQNSLDIVSGDIATFRKNLVAVLRLKSAAPDPVLVGGLTYTFDFSSGGTAYQLVYRVYAGGEHEGQLVVGGVSQAVDAVADLSTSSVTWVVPRKLIPALKKTGAKLSGLGATTSVGNNAKTPSGSMRGSFGADTATSGKSYTDMAPTCLKGT